MPKPTPKVSLSYSASPFNPSSSSKSISKVDSLTLLVRVALPPGWHINSEAPPDSFLVPTRLDVEAKGMEFGKPRFPAPEMVFSAAMGEKMPLHSGVFEIKVPAKPSKAQATGTETPATKVTLHYQACNDAMCLPPKDVTAELPVGVAAK